jgi:hypothetical protein
VFASEVVVVVLILFLARRMAEPPRPDRAPLDVLGAALTALGLGLAVCVGLGQAKARRSLFGWRLAFGVWLVVLGGLIILAFVEWESRLTARGREPLIQPALSAIGK